MAKEIEYFTHPKGSIFEGMTVRTDPDNAFENAIKRGMKNPEDWMYMYSKNDRDYFKHCDYRTYKSYPQYGPVQTFFQKFNKHKKQDKDMEL